MFHTDFVSYIPRQPFVWLLIDPEVGAFEQSGYCLVDLGKGLVGQRPASDQNAIPAGRNVVEILAHDLAQQPPCPVPSDSIADTFAGNESKAVEIKSIGDYR